MPALIERRKMTKSMYQSLKRHILREREKRKQEQEADVALERQRKEAEKRRRLEQENTATTLEQTKEELNKLEVQLDNLRKDKSKLFAQLKRILESESTKKENEKKLDPQQYHLQGHNPPVQFLSGTGHMGRPVMFKPPHPSQMASSMLANPNAGQAMKRGRSPSPNPSGSQQLYHYGQDYSAPKTYQHPKAVLASPQSSSSQVYHQTSQAGPSVYGAPQAKYAHPSQGAFSSYIGHSSQSQKPTSDSFSAYTIGQQLQHEKNRNSDDKLGRINLPTRGPHQHQTPQKGSIMTGYPVHSAHSSQTQQSVITPSSHPRNLSRHQPYSHDRYYQR